MLKFIFWTLLLANGAALGFNLGYLNGAIPNGREPQRMQRQMHPEQLLLLTAGAKAAAAAAGPGIAAVTRGHKNVPTLQNYANPGRSAGLPQIFRSSSCAAASSAA